MNYFLIFLHSYKSKLENFSFGKPFVPASKISSIYETIHRESNSSAHVVLNLIKEMGKRDKMQGLPSILLLICNQFNKFNNTQAGMLDSVYHEV